MGYETTSTQMVDEMLFAPNELPNLTKDLLDFPEIKKEEKSLYSYLFDQLGAKWEDLVADSLNHPKMCIEEFEVRNSPCCNIPTNTVTLNRC